MISEPLEKGLAEDIENEVVQISWSKYGTLGSHDCLLCTSCSGHMTTSYFLLHPPQEEDW